MSKTFKILLLVLLAVIVLQSVAIGVLYRRNARLIENPPMRIVIGIPRYDRSVVSPKTFAEMFSSVSVDGMVFDNLTLVECLQKLDKGAGLLGIGHISTHYGQGIDPERRISLKFKNTTYSQILKALEETCGVTIEVTKSCIYANYGKPGEKKQ
jgi:hypothetical protein